MKRIALTAIAAALALTSLAPTASAEPRNDNRWDQSRDNGYTYNGQWHYGRPPSNVMNRPGFQVGWHQWRRGDRLPSDFHHRYTVLDYRHEHLRAPPRGYHYVRDDRGDVLLVGIATGVILSSIAGAH